MGFLTEHCSLRVLTRDILASCKPFVCGNADLDDYFRNDATLYQEQRLGKTYCYLLDEDPSVIVCAFTLSSDSVRVDLVVDSYNTPHTVHYYQKNGFEFLFSTEEQEAKNSGIPLPLHTRYMYYDLIDVVN